MADASSIFKSQFKFYISTLKELSLDKEKNVKLCQDESQKAYDFDEIIKRLYPLKQPASYDALVIDGKNIYCIEFKNQKYSDIENKNIQKKLINGRDALNEIFLTYNMQVDEYRFVYCVAYKNNVHKWRRGITKNIIQFELEEYIGIYFDEIYTNDIQFFTHEYKKHFYKELSC